MERGWRIEAPANGVEVALRSPRALVKMHLLWHPCLHPGNKVRAVQLSALPVDPHPLLLPRHKWPPVPPALGPPGLTTRVLHHCLPRSAQDRGRLCGQRLADLIPLAPHSWSSSSCSLDPMFRVSRLPCILTPLIWREVSPIRLEASVISLPDCVFWTQAATSTVPTWMDSQTPSPFPTWML